MTISRVNIYRSEEGKSRMQWWYQQIVDGISEPHEFVTVDTRFGETNVMLAGPKDAPPLLCVHGVMSAAPHAFTQVESLARRFRMILPDIVGQPGRSAQTQPAMRGEPYGQWCIDVLDGLGLETVSALGASMGGFVLVRAATIAPERFDKLILWTPAGLVNGKFWDGMKLTAAMIRYSTFGNEGALDTMLTSVSSDMTDHWRAFYADSFKHVKVDARMPQMAKPSELAALKAPVMVIGHEQDPLFPADRLEKKARTLFPNLQTVLTVPGVRHVPPFDAEKRQPIVDAIETFLDH